MGVTGILALAVMLILVVTIYYIIMGIKQKNWKKVLFCVVGFLVFVALLYFGLLSFITSM